LSKGRVQLNINEQYLVLVRLPKEKGQEYDSWGTVAVVRALTMDEAIEKAIKETPALYEHVPPGIMRFMAVPRRLVPVRLASAVGQDIVAA
jgi:hypothetical protein